MYHVLPDLNAQDLGVALNALGPDDKIVQIVYISGAGWYTLVYWAAP